MIEIDAEKTLGYLVLAVIIIGIFAALLAIAHFDIKLFRVQKRAVDRYMRPTFDNGLLHSEADFKEAAKEKSLAMLFRQLMVPLPLFIVFLVVLVSVSAAVCDSAREWWLSACFGLEGIYNDMNLLIGLVRSNAIPAGKGYLTFLIPTLNILTVADLVVILLAEQGHIARRIRIMEIVSLGWRTALFPQIVKTDTAEKSK